MQCLLTLPPISKKTCGLTTFQIRARQYIFKTENSPNAVKKINSNQPGKKLSALFSSKLLCYLTIIPVIFSLYFCYWSRLAYHVFT